MFEGRLRWILGGTAGLFAVFLARVLFLQTAGAEASREAVESRRHGTIALPPRRGAVRDADGVLLARDETGFDLMADSRSLGAVEWRCGREDCGRVCRTWETDPGPGPDAEPPLPAEAPPACRCGSTDLRRVEGDDAPGSLADLLGEPTGALEERVGRIRARGWTTARAAARRRGERWRRVTLRDWLGRRRCVASGLSREAALEIALDPERFPGFTVEARHLRRVEEGLDPATLSVLGRTGPPTPADAERLRREGLGPAEVHSLAVGRSGVERAFDRDLRGSFGTERASRDLYGRVLGRESVDPVVDGEDLRLACSSRLNAAAEGILAGRPGAIVALDPRDGALRAVAGAAGPEEGAPLLAGQGEEPGSVMKVLPALVALEGGVAPAAGEVDCRGRASKPLPCEHDHGSPGMREALSGSCNAYFAATALRIGVRPLEDFARLLHIDRPYGIGLGAEGGGTDWIQDSFPPRRPWVRTDLANLGIGQGPILLSPLQVGSLYCAIANGGHPVLPYLVEGKGRSPGSAVLSSSTTAQVRAGLEDTVRIGTASNAGLQEFRAAGKTGTAQAGEDAEGRRKLNAWFAGYAPAEDPRIVVVVLLADQRESGGRAAAPLAAEFLRAWRDWSRDR